MADNLALLRGGFAPVATRNDYYLPLAHTMGDRLMVNWIQTAQASGGKPRIDNVRRLPEIVFYTISSLRHVLELE